MNSEKFLTKLSLEPTDDGVWFLCDDLKTGNQNKFFMTYEQIEAMWRLSNDS